MIIIVRVCPKCGSSFNTDNPKRAYCPRCTNELTKADNKANREEFYKLTNCTTIKQFLKAVHEGRIEVKLNE